MQPTIIARRIAIGAEIRSYVAHRLGFALDRSRHRIRAVTVRLMDRNGHRGGVDKLCRIQVEVDGQAPLVVSDVAGDLRAAIDGAAHRAAQALARTLRRSVAPLRRQGRLARRLPAAEEADFDLQPAF